MNRFSRIQQFTLGLWAASTLSFMAMMSIGGSLAGIVGIWTAFRDRDNWRRNRATFYWVPTVFLMVVATLSLVFAYLDPPLGIPIQGFNEIKKFRYFLLPIFGAFLLLSVTRAEKSSLENAWFWKVLLGMTVLSGLISVFQFYAGTIFGESFVINGKTLLPDGNYLLHQKRFFRIISTTLHSHAQGLMFFHLSFATAISFCLSYLLARVLWPMAGDTRKIRVFLAGTTLLTAAALYFTYSRIAWVALIAVFGILFFLRKPKWGIVALGLTLVLGGVLWFSSPSVQHRLLDGPGWYGRFHVWKASLEMAKDRPLLGVGFGKSGHYTDHYAERYMDTVRKFSSHAHNNMLDALATTGVLGLIAYLFWFGLLGYYCIKLYRKAPKEKRWLPAALLAGWLGFQVNGLTQVNFYDGKSQHSLMFWAALVLALWWREAHSSTSEYSS